MVFIVSIKINMKKYFNSVLICGLLTVGSVAVSCSGEKHDDSHSKGITSTPEGMDAHSTSKDTTGVDRLRGPGSVGETDKMNTTTDH